MEPFIKYPGGKTKEIPLVKKFMPRKVKRYFEPFVGGGSIYFCLDIKDAYINDKSEDLMNLYRCVKEQNEELRNLLLSTDDLWKKIEHRVKKEDFLRCGLDYKKFRQYSKQSLNRKRSAFEKLELEGTKVKYKDKKATTVTAKKTAFYMLIRDIYNMKENNIRHIASYYFMREYCYSSMFRFSKNGEFNVPYGGRSYDLKYMNSKIQKMFSNDIQKYMETTDIYDEDFADFLMKFDFKEDDFIFLDPPYDTDFSTYDNNSFDKEEQVRLRDTLADIKAPWMLIIKKTDFIYELYKDFNVYEYNANYMVSFKNRNDRKVEHLLITNYKIEEEIL